MSLSGTLIFSASFSLKDELPSAQSTTEKDSLPEFVQSENIEGAVALVVAQNFVHWQLTGLQYRSVPLHSAPRVLSAS